MIRHAAVCIVFALFASAVANDVMSESREVERGAVAAGAEAVDTGERWTKLGNGRERWRANWLRRVNMEVTRYNPYVIGEREEKGGGE